MVSNPNVTRAEDGPDHHLQRNKMSVGAIVFFVIAAVAPLGAVIGGSPVVFASVGPGAPAVYLMVGVLFAMFCAGYVAMSRHISNAGGFVAYVAEGFGPKAASALAGISLVGYLALVTGFWSFFGALLQMMIEGKYGIDIPPAAWIVGLISVITWLTWRGIDVSLRVLGGLLVLEIAVLIVVVLAVIVAGGDAGLSADGFSWSQVAVPGFGLAFLFATTCFTGFEATVVFSEEARDPRRTIPRAAYIGITLIALFYAITTWALSMGYGTANVQAVAEADPAAFVFVLAERYAGPWVTGAMEWLVITSLIAMFIGFHNIVSRYIFAIARAGLLPDRLSLADRKSGSPGNAAIAMGMTVLAINLGFLLSGADPMNVTFPWMSALGTVAIITGLIAASLSVVAFFARTGVDNRLWHTRIAPVIASIGFSVAGVIAILNYDTLLGGQGGVARWLLLLLPVAALAGWSVAASKLARGGKIDYAASLN